MKIDRFVIYHIMLVIGIISLSFVLFLNKMQYGYLIILPIWLITYYILRVSDKKNRQNKILEGEC